MLHRRYFYLLAFLIKVEKFLLDFLYGNACALELLKYWWIDKIEILAVFCERKFFASSCKNLINYNCIMHFTFLWFKEVVKVDFSHDSQSNTNGKRYFPQALEKIIMHSLTTSTFLLKQSYFNTENCFIGKQSGNGALETRRRWRSTGSLTTPVWCVA